MTGSIRNFEKLNILCFSFKSEDESYFARSQHVFTAQLNNFSRDICASRSYLEV